MDELLSQLVKHYLIQNEIDRIIILFETLKNDLKSPNRDRL